ncbi:hypothetical protein HN51_018748 [Arachis hypogaea]
MPLPSPPSSLLLPPSLYYRHHHTLLHYLGHIQASTHQLLVEAHRNANVHNLRREDQRGFWSMMVAVTVAMLATVAVVIDGDESWMINNLGNGGKRSDIVVKR